MKFWSLTTYEIFIDLENLQTRELPMKILLSKPIIIVKTVDNFGTKY